MIASRALQTSVFCILTIAIRRLIRECFRGIAEREVSLEFSLSINKIRNPCRYQYLSLHPDEQNALENGSLLEPSTSGVIVWVAFHHELAKQ